MLTLISSIIVTMDREELISSCPCFLTISFNVRVWANIWLSEYVYDKLRS